MLRLSNGCHIELACFWIEVPAEIPQGCSGLTGHGVGECLVDWDTVVKRVGRAGNIIAEQALIRIVGKKVVKGK